MSDYPGIDTTVPMLGDALRHEISRVRAAHQDAHSRFALKYAARAMQAGDVVKMLNALGALKAKK
jgi:hypothetical protein